MIASLMTPTGRYLCLVECKRYCPDRPVGVSLVRSLLGVVKAKRVTQGLLVTTSRFTRDAREFAEQVPHQLSLREYFDLLDWLNAVRR